jgi:hypothetical protein
VSRKGHEFNQRTKDLAIRKWHAENPGRENEKLEVDHKVGVDYAKRNGIPPAVTKQADNARAMPVSEHKQRHRDATDEEMNGHLSGIARFVGRLFE